MCLIDIIHEFYNGKNTFIHYKRFALVIFFIIEYIFHLPPGKPTHSHPSEMKHVRGGAQH